MTRPQPTSRTLSPHALAHDGFRWHARAYCHTRKEFRDFVIARVLEVNGSEPAATASAEDDQEWHTIVPLVLVPHPNLSESHRRAIELDFGMKDGQIEFQCRQAFLFYALRHLRLDLEQSARPEAQQIALKNRASSRQFMAGGYLPPNDENGTGCGGQRLKVEFDRNAAIQPLCFITASHSFTPSIEPLKRRRGQRPLLSHQTPTNFIRIRRTLFAPVTRQTFPYSTVTLLAKFRGLSTSVPFTSAA